MKLYLLEPTKEKWLNIMIESHLRNCPCSRSLAESELKKQFTVKELNALIETFITYSSTTKLVFRKKVEQIETLFRHFFDALRLSMEQFLGPEKNILKMYEHWEYFIQGKSTSTLKWSKRSKFWESRRVSSAFVPEWWPKSSSAAMEPWLRRTLYPTCHVISDSSGTDCDHTSKESTLPNRLGRRKVFMFANGLICVAKCVKVNELQGDLALLVVENVQGTLDEKVGKAVLIDEKDTNNIRLSDEIFCIGNPSDVNLESECAEANNFEPKGWHLSYGKVEVLKSCSADTGQSITIFLFIFIHVFYATLIVFSASLQKFSNK
ncbi:hypothetical protein RFI_23118 [Reticulomyxa filosa]|uniref:Uncharacterized protein n=1 Tax=Reticulomyxa filosa TaxID=46433 RepID=X6MME0_RETFI|nr:hypothetical protein RFI_23118 [Reticulomyxa filosa]|eukprot:ETO14250.1 hypothetical protein RFI_23118 [Reticulomyxa filosa]